MKELLLCCLAGLLICTVVVAVGNGLSRIDCYRFGKASGYDVKYVNYSGCYAKQPNDKWLPTDKLRGDSD